MLAQRGAVVIAIDNRGTPYLKGRKWRKVIYRQIGILASSDQAKAVKAILASRVYLDETRVAVWGWSGGGSMSLNALFRYPDIYSAAVSVAPVPVRFIIFEAYSVHFVLRTVISSIFKFTCS